MSILIFQYCVGLLENIALPSYQVNSRYIYKNKTEKVQSKTARQDCDRENLI